jgi:polysaccharide export outer membrane protein
MIMLKMIRRLFTRIEVTLLLYAMLSACSSVASNSDLARTARASAPPADTCPSVEVAAGETRDDHSRIRAGDELHISFYLSPEFDRDVTVQPDGTIDLQVSGQLMVAGLTTQQAADSIDRAYEGELREPQASIVVKHSPSRVVYVEGEVGKPGSITLVPQMTAMEAIAQAGGFTDSAGTHHIVLIRRDGCGNPHGENLDLAKVKNQKDLEQDAGVLPGDLIVVPKSGIANLDLIVKQYARDLMPVQPYMTLPLF